MAAALMAGGGCADGDGRGQMADGRWQMADGGWRMADGRWRMADGRWRKRVGGAISEAAISEAAFRHPAKPPGT